MTFWPLTNSDFSTDQTFHQFYYLDTELDLHRIMSGFHGRLQQVWHASRENIPIRTPGSVPVKTPGGGGLSREYVIRIPSVSEKATKRAVSRNHRIKRLVPCRCRTGTLKNPAKCLWRWEPDRRHNFFSLSAYLCAVTYMTEILFHVTLNSNKLNSNPFGTCLCSNCLDQIHRTCHVFTRLFTLIPFGIFSNFLSLFEGCFSSPEPKAQLSYCHSAPSVRPSSSSVNFHIFNLFSRTPVGTPGV